LITISFNRGELIIKENDSMKKLPAFKYEEIVSDYESHGVQFNNQALATPECPRLDSSFTSRDYQNEALESWLKSRCKGVVVLPTGAGKTILAIKAMEKLQVATLVIVPTLVLVDQWRKTLLDAFNVDIGSLGGGLEDIKPITVSTYDSARLRIRELGNKFLLIIFDEVHHLPSSMNMRIGYNYLAPYRLGLTATIGKEPDANDVLTEIVGNVVYERAVDDLAGKHLSEYTIQTIKLPLYPDEKLEYDRFFTIYRNFLLKRGYKMRSAKDYLRFVKMSGRDPEARRALLSRNSAMDIALNSKNKIEYLKDLLKTNPNEKTLIFTRHNKLVYTISRELLIPAITHQTMADERQEVLDHFRKGIYKRIVTSQVLDEGVDVPDASMAVILSGTGSSREFIQRLGRILRKKEGKKAVLYEIVSSDTAETRISWRRKQG
jgi:superfamily II DNA or RNA helicase